MAAELYPAYPGTIATLHIESEDVGEEELLNRFEDICDFIGECVCVALCQTRVLQAYCMLSILVNIFVHIIHIACIVRIYVCVGGLHVP